MGYTRIHIHVYSIPLLHQNCAPRFCDSLDHGTDMLGHPQQKDATALYVVLHNRRLIHRQSQPICICICRW